MLSREQFEQELAPLRAVLEQRRKRHLRYYYVGLACAALFLGTALLSPAAVLHFMQAPLKVRPVITPNDILGYRIFALLCAVSLSLGPIMSYRGSRDFSVERAVFTRLLGSFGNFAAAEGGGIQAAEIRRAGLFAPPLLFAPEEGVMGEVDGVRIRLCEAAFFKREDGQDTLVFNGLFLLYDLPPGGAAADEGLIRERLDELARLAREFPPAEVRWDEKLVYALRALLVRLKRAFLLRTGKEELPAEKEYRLKYAMNPLLARAGLPQMAEPFCMPYGFECSLQRCVAAVAGHGGLFTLGSLFTPSLPSTRMDHLYEVMEKIGSLSLQLNRAVT